MSSLASSTVVFLKPIATIELTKTKTLYGKNPLTLRKIRRAIRLVLPRLTRVPCKARQTYKAHAPLFSRLNRPYARLSERSC